MLIAIDAGHYKNTPGRRCLKELDPKETREWELNRRVADELQNLLISYDCEYQRMDDPTGEVLYEIGNRAKKANEIKADCYISIHHNAGIKGGSGGGCVVYTAPNCQAKSKTFQASVYNHVVKYTNLKGNRSKPLSQASYLVLTHTNMPAVLIECGFMDSKTDVPVILKDDFASKVAKGLLEALVEVFGLKQKEAKKEHMKYIKQGNTYIVTIPVSDFSISLVDRAKKKAHPGNYCNAGFFGNYNEGKDKFTLPVGHTISSFDASSVWCKHYCQERGKIKDGKLIYSEPGKVETVLYINGNEANMGEFNKSVDFFKYAIAGVPVLRNGKAVSWTEAKAQGWEASSLYATWHIFAGFGKDHSKITVVSMKTTTGNLISSGEGAKKLAALGLTDAIKLDGGGSTILHVSGKDVVSTAGNRRICTILCFGGNPYQVANKTLKKGSKGEMVKWLQWELNDRGFKCGIDGSFGPATDTALRAFQASAGLNPDGSCGPATRAKLI